MLKTLLLTLLTVAGSAPAEPTTRPVPNRTRVERLVEQLASPRYGTREQATDALRDMGHGVVERLEPYRNHPDAEVAKRVRDVIAAFAWRNRGAIVVGIVPDTQAEKTGMAVGDVVLRADETDIASASDLIRFGLAPRTYHVLREGTVRPFPMKQGKAGIWVGDWDRSLAGQDHHLGLRLLGQENFAQAYRRLNRAYGAGLRDRATMNRLVGLAEYELDHATAMKIVREVRSDLPQSARTYFVKGHFGPLGERLPFVNVDTALRLADFAKDPDAVDLRMELYEYALERGRNTPWARQIAAPSPPDEGPLFNAAKLPSSWAELAIYDGRLAELRNHRSKVTEDLKAGPGRDAVIPRPQWGQPRAFQHPDGAIRLDGGEVYLRRDDDWVPTGASPGLPKPILRFWRNPTVSSALRHVVEKEIGRDTGRTLLGVQTDLLEWDVYFFQHDRALAVRRSDGRVVDLSERAATLLGREHPAAVYTCGPLNDDRLLIPTGAGLLTMDAEGKLRRIDLPIKDQNVHLCLLDYPKREGKVYVGVAAHQGGQIVELDAGSGKARLTGGFNGLGPDDGFHPFGKLLAEQDPEQQQSTRILQRLGPRQETVEDD